MLELIFQGFVEWIYGLILEAWEYFSNVLLDIMSLDFAYLRSHMPIIDTIMQIMLAVGWALFIGNLVFQAVKSMVTGLGFEAEDPRLLFTRSFAFAFLLLASPQICRLCLDMTSTIIGVLQMPDAVDITFADDASFGGLAASWLLVVICGIIVMFQTFKLIMEMAERYFILSLLTITAPLAFAMGGSRNTSDIFTGWGRMFGSMCVLMVMNIVFVKMLLSALSFYPSGLDVLPWMVLVVTIVKVAKKADSILSRIGLNPALTGDPLGRSFPGMLAYTVVRSMASNVARTIGRSGRGGAAASQSGSPNGPRPAGPAGGVRAGSNTSTAHTRNQSSSAQQTAVHTGTQQDSCNPQSAQQTTSQQDTQNHSATSVSESSQSQQAGTQSHSSRHTSVPPGTRRAPVHVPAASAGKAANQNGQAAAGNFSAQTAQQNQTQAQSNLHSSFGSPVQNITGTAAGSKRSSPGMAASAPAPGTAPHTPRSSAPRPDMAGTTPVHAQQNVSDARRTSVVQSTAVPSAAGGSSGISPATGTVTQPSTAPQAGKVENASAPRTVDHCRSSPARDTAGNSAQLRPEGYKQSAPVPGTAGVCIGGRYAQNSTQTVHPAQNGPRSGAPAVSAPASQPVERPSQPAGDRSSKRPLATGPIPAGTQASTVQNVSGQATIFHTDKQTSSATPISSASTTPRSTSRPAHARTPSASEPQHVVQRTPAATPAGTEAMQSALPERKTQRPAQPAATASVKSPTPTTAMQSGLTQNAPPQTKGHSVTERSGRNPASITTATTPHALRPSDAPVRQESRSTASTIPPANAAASPSPAQQEKRMPPSAPASNREPAIRPGPAGMAAPKPMQSGSSAQSTTRQEPAQAVKKPFVPLMGKQPESIPSHLDLKQESQKSTKRSVSKDDDNGAG